MYVYHSVSCIFHSIQLLHMVNKMPHIHISAAILKIAAILYLSYSVIILNIKSWLRPFAYKIVNFKLYRVYFNGISFDFGSHLWIGSHFFCLVLFMGLLLRPIIKFTLSLVLKIFFELCMTDTIIRCDALIYFGGHLENDSDFEMGLHHFLISRT